MVPVCQNVIVFKCHASVGYHSGIESIQVKDFLFAQMDNYEIRFHVIMIL